ncbi:DUF3060 domain-containing protein [Mycobacterium sp. IDR2000157661]|uniref:DUF3060 domain-containing protein n=1 Tax=Mycobacterium sp. IDR2000157661 TaxID=2867005 RepID=UPI001EE9DB89|nr:DUF3060 domain-containing protein [Mycobacterium sp. IDR2000157661]ULE32969.1 DUF3060 domain-containing protein [Mycobacterium sp. IDR2000157661]
MRAHSLRLTAGCGVAAAALALSGCGAQAPAADLVAQTEATVQDNGAQVEVGNTIYYGSFGTTAEVDCGDGKTLNVGGSNNTLDVNGTCSSVIVGGADNKITLATVQDEIDVVGVNNTVTYADGDPRIDDVGSGNTVEKAPVSE